VAMLWPLIHGSLGGCCKRSLALEGEENSGMYPSRQINPLLLLGILCINKNAPKYSFTRLMLKTVHSILTHSHYINC